MGNLNSRQQNIIRAALFGLFVLAEPVCADPCADFRVAVSEWKTAEHEVSQGKLGQALVDSIKAQLAANDAALALRAYVRNPNAKNALKALEGSASRISIASLYANSWRMDGAPHAPTESPDVYDYERIVKAGRVTDVIAAAEYAILVAYYDAVGMMAACQ